MKSLAQSTSNDIKVALSLPDSFTDAHIAQVLDYLFKDKRGHIESGKSNFDNVLDYRYVYSSFRQVYNVDLNKEELTWWEYSAMLEGCFNADCLIATVAKYRNMKIPPKAKEKEKKAIMNLKHKYMLRTEDNGLGRMFSSLKGASKNGS